MINDLTLTVFGSQALSEQMTFAEAIKKIYDMECLHIGEVTERAISIKTNIAMCNRCTPEIDLVNGVQIKSAKTHPESVQANTMNAWFTKRKMTAPVALVVHEIVTDKYFYFWIPPEAYRQSQANAVSIRFDADGTPRRTPQRMTKLPNWWDFECKGGFDELCQYVMDYMPPAPVINSLNPADLLAV